MFPLILLVGIRMGLFSPSAVGAFAVAMPCLSVYSSIRGLPLSPF